jgi:uncharacterized membrane protein
LYLRLPLQIILIGLVFWFTRSDNKKLSQK